MDNLKYQRILDIIQLVKSLDQKQGDELAEWTGSNFSMDDLALVSAFFHETCKIANRQGMYAFFSDFK